MNGKRMLGVIGIILGFLILIEALALARLGIRVGTFASYWKNQNDQAQGDLLYVALGDSAAQGIGASEPEKGYVGLLSKALLEDQGTAVKRINLSVSGAKTRDAIREQLPKLKKLNIPSDAIVTLDIGANDMRTFNAETFKHDMDELLSQVPKQTVIADIPYFGGGRFRMLESNVRVANLIIYDLAAEHNLKTAPLYDITKKRDSLKVYAADLFHPSNTGYRNWADAFKLPLGLQ